MAKYLIQNKIASKEGIEEFSALGFEFKEFKDNCYTFVSS
jgi:cytoplasmic iron level regulating protein YaaA (DUF328/UPF0246 family)